MRRSLWHLTFYVTAGAFVLMVMPASGDNAWGPYHWARDKNPVTIVLGDNVDSRWDDWLAEASSDWTVSSVLYTPVENGKAKGNCKPPDGRVEVCNKNYGFNGWLGLAQIWVSGEHIAKGAVKLNDSYHDLSPYNGDGWRDIVMCQEVGHTFGLNHQDVTFDNGNLGTCMDYTNNPDGPPANRSPDDHDFYTLNEIYGDHTEGGGGGGGGQGGNGCKGKAKKNCSGSKPPPPAFDMELAGIGQWGRLIGTSRDGGQSRFVQDFGNGYRVYTHVTWTLEIAEGLAARRR